MGIVSFPGEEQTVTLWVTSPTDSNGSLRAIDRLFETSCCQRAVIKIKPENLKDLETKIHEIQARGLRIRTIFFNCHSLPIAVKITRFIIQMPAHPRFNSERYFAEYSSMQRVPRRSEYESFDHLVDIIRKALVPRGKVVLLGCSTAVDTEHPEKNIAGSLARRLPKHIVIGTKWDIDSRDLNIADSPELITGNVLKQVAVEKRSINKVERLVMMIFSPIYS
jgi:hypothetical protein